MYQSLNIEAYGSRIKVGIKKLPEFAARGAYNQINAYCTVKLGGGDGAAATVDEVPPPAISPMGPEFLISISSKSIYIHVPLAGED